MAVVSWFDGPLYYDGISYVVNIPAPSVCMADLGELLKIHTNVPAEQPLKAPAPVAPEPEPVPVPA